MVINLNGDDLEKALNENSDVNENTSDKPVMNRDEEIGFHKGAVNTLAAERNELVKMIGNVEGIMQAHMTRLGELGVKMNEKEK